MQTLIKAAAIALAASSAAPVAAQEPGDWPVTLQPYILIPATPRSM